MYCSHMILCNCILLLQLRFPFIFYEKREYQHPVLSFFLYMISAVYYLAFLLFLAINKLISTQIFHLIAAHP